MYNQDKKKEILSWYVRRYFSLYLIEVHLLNKKNISFVAESLFAIT